MTPRSGSELRFSFRRLVNDDLPMMHTWLNEPGVVQWWEGEDVSWDGVVQAYSPDSAESESGDGGAYENWIAEIDGGPVGWICCWPVLSGLDESEPWFPLGVERTAAGIDYLVAAPDRRGQGVGSAMIRAFCFNVVFGQHCEWTQAAASPYTANVASCRALEKAGFSFAGSVSYSAADGDCSLLTLNRPESER